MASDAPPVDADLVPRLLERDPEAWALLLERHGPMIAATCRRAHLHAGRKPDDADVADAAAEVIRLLLEDDGRVLRGYRPGIPLGAYLHVIARHRTIDALRRSHPSGIPWLSQRAPDPDPAESLLAAERNLKLGKALELIPSRNAQLLRLFYLEGLNYPGIAQETGIPQAQLGVLLQRARESLREKLGQDFPEML